MRLPPGGGERPAAVSAMEIKLFEIYRGGPAVPVGRAYGAIALRSADTEEE